MQFAVPTFWKERRQEEHKKDKDKQREKRIKINRKTKEQTSQNSLSNWQFLDTEIGMRCSSSDTICSANFRQKKRNQPTNKERKKRGKDGMGKRNRKNEKAGRKEINMKRRRKRRSRKKEEKPLKPEMIHRDLSYIFPPAPPIVFLSPFLLLPAPILRSLGVSWDLQK